jgi:O-antigen ligase
VRSEATSSGIVPVVLLVLLVGLLIAALQGRGRRRRAAAALLLPVSAAWVLFNGPIEGPILLTFSTDHGLTVSDLLAAVGVLVGGVVLVRGNR